MEDELRRPGVLEHVVDSAVNHVRQRIIAGRIASEHNKTRHRVRLPRAVALPARVVLEFWDGDDDDNIGDDEEGGDAGADFKVLVEFLREISGWSGSVFKVRVSEHNSAAEENDENVELYAVKIRLSDELPDADASNERAFATMALMQELGRTRDLCPFPIHYQRKVPLPAMTKKQRRAFYAQPGMQRDLPPISALICTWIEGERIPTPLAFTPDAWETWWKPLVQLRASIARVKKPRLMSAPTLSPCYCAVRNICDHEAWLENLDTRIGALSYVYHTKRSQDIVPEWLEKYLGETVRETGMPRIKHLGRRLGLCLSKLQALSRDGEATQDLRLCVADPSTDNVLKLDEHRGRLCVLDLENSGWAQPSYIVAEMLVHNVWLDKPGVEASAFPFDPGFMDFVALTFAKMIRLDSAEMSRYKERMALHVEFCVLRALLFHIRGALQGLGHMINGSRSAALSPGSGSGSGGGSARLGGNCGKWSPTRVGGFGSGNGKSSRDRDRGGGRTALNAYGFPQRFRATHRDGVELFRSMLGGSDYSRRTLDRMIKVQSYLDAVVEAEKKSREKEKQLARALAFAQCERFEF